MDISTFDNAFKDDRSDTLMEEEEKVDPERIIEELKALIEYFKKKNASPHDLKEGS